MTTATFTADTTTNYANPGRGWHFQSGTLDNSTSMDLPNFAADAAGLPTPLQNVTLNNVLTSLGSGVPSAGALSNWQTSFNLSRSTGVMLGLRFIGSGSAAQTVAQCQAIAPILLTNRDVIAYVQCGFRCDFGEWATGCADNNNVADKTTVFDAIVAMVPTNITVELTQVYPRETWFSGTTPTTLTDMKMGGVKGRTGTHSDCFGTGNGDSSFYTFVGTLTGFTSTMTAAQQAAYIQATSANTMFGVETCSDSGGAATQMRTACTGATDAQGLAGGILNEGPRYHVCHINGSYAPNFLSSWSSGGCLGTVANMMGYRFQYDDVTVASSVARGGTLIVDVRMRNYGWARNFDQRRLHVLLVNGGTTIDCAASTQLRELDPQATSSSLVRVTCAIPAGTSVGSYSLSLKMPSPFSTTQANPFTIRNANATGGGGSWDSTNYRWNTGIAVSIT